MKFSVRAGVELHMEGEEEEYHKRKCFPLRFGFFFLMAVIRNAS